jgi:CMP-N-acetylneuraminic acid synthetase
MNILITLCARGGSKGIPGKNIRSINGKPLIAYSIDTAKKFAEKHNATIALSTDSTEIIEVAKQHGLHTNYIRPADLATDTAGKIDVLKDILHYTEEQDSCAFDYLLDLDITSPLRTGEDLEKALNQLVSNPEAYNIFSVNHANRNPYFNMVELGVDGYVNLVKQSHGVKTRQQAPPVYDMNASFYIYRRSFFIDDQKRATTDKSLAYVMEHICFDLDHPIDFTMMELMMKNNLLDFEL